MRAAFRDMMSIAVPQDRREFLNPLGLGAAVLALPEALTPFANAMPPLSRERGKHAVWG